VADGGKGGAVAYPAPGGVRLDHRLEVGLDFDDTLAQGGGHLLCHQGCSLSERGVFQAYVEAMNQDQIGDCVAVLQQGVERVDPARENTPTRACSPAGFVAGVAPMTSGK